MSIKQAIAYAQARLTGCINPYAEANMLAMEQWPTDELIAAGYRFVMNPLLGGYTKGFNPDTEYLFLRRNWPEPQKFRLSDQPEWFNVSGLYWKAL